MPGEGFVTRSEYQKHIRGEWRTVHNLWPHIRKYVPGWGYSKAEIDAMFVGTEGSIAFADATGFIAEDNTNFAWNNTLKVLEVLAPTNNTYIGKGVIGGGESTGNYNVFLGYEVGYSITSAHNNTFMGCLAGRLNTTADKGTLVGYYAGYSITTSPQNTCFGSNAGDNISTGQGQNTCVGHGSGGALSTGHFNVMIGADTGGSITTGYKNTCLGYNAEVFHVGSHHRIAIGYNAMSKEDNLCVIGGTAAADAVSLAIFYNKEFRFYDDGNNYVGFKAPALGANQIWTLPAADGDPNDVLITDGGGELGWLPGVATDEKVKVDVGAVAGYLGVAFNDGVLRTGAPLTYADGGDFVTLGVDPSAIKLDDLGAPDDNADLDFSTAKHGLVPKGTDVGHFLKDDGTWAAGGGGGAVVFTDLTDTPANYAGAANKIVKVNATPDALEFGADIEDLEDVDTLVGQAGKYAKVKVGDAGIEWAAVAGDGGGYGKEVIDEDFDALINGDIHGQGAYSGWAAWNTDVEDADCSAQIVANPGNGKMLRLTDGNVAGLVNTRLDADAGREIIQCLFKCKMEISTFASTNNRGYVAMFDKAANFTGLYFRDDALWWWNGASAVSIMAAVANTWYDVTVFMDCTASKAVIWVDDVLKLTGQACGIENIETLKFYTLSVSPAAAYTVDFDDLLVVDLIRKP